MLAFITTLRHPQNSVSYDRVEKLLDETLRSVAQQTSEEFVIIIVGNKRPDFSLPARTHFVQVEFPPPAPPTGAQTAREPFVWDKGTKLGIGLIAAAEYDPTHVMIFDADDFVHRDLAKFVQDNPAHPGWVVREGWMYSRARNAYVAQSNFNRTCGTSFVVPFEAYGVPGDLSVTASQQEIAAGYADRLSAIMGAHRDAEAWHRDHGRVLAEFPFRAAVYHVDTGENHSAKSLSGLARPYDERLRRDFGIEPSRGIASTLWAAVGPLAIGEEVKRLARRVITRLARLRGTAR
ncbi:glycosyltransferase family 2 protein [Herbiconiux sp. VKM Ac-1786]|uniref:glycosyltransferase family A protein n=1 Tax=Herbiconiux sp. VKM Ac-1786 TaxID=2783824 RepID=UPI00188B7346|nr:glycosyltransferase family A protein [Herbiconiux sp. VKM Ac-1786]MBF4572935.1 glycosyltransferase family 2 protein [Herbiconiux sp. VKM Ac-1786]